MGTCSPPPWEGLANLLAPPAFNKLDAHFTSEERW